MVRMRDPRDDNEENRPDAPAGLYFSRRGNWFHDGDRIFHAGLSGLLDRSVARDADGGLIVTTGHDVLPFISEDAPVMIRQVLLGAGGLWTRLSTGHDEPLPAIVAIGSDHRLRVPVAGGRWWALMSRAAGQALEPLFQVDSDEAIWIVDGDVRHRVCPLDADWRQLPTLSGDVGAGTGATPP